MSLQQQVRSLKQENGQLAEANRELKKNLETAESKQQEWESECNRYVHESRVKVCMNHTNVVNTTNTDVFWMIDYIIISLQSCQYTYYLCMHVRMKESIVCFCGPVLS